MRALAIVNLLGWVAFLLVDRAWHGVLREAVSDREGTYGEWYGPLSTLRPLALYASLTLTAVLSLGVLLRSGACAPRPSSSEQTAPPADR